LFLGIAYELLPIPFDAVPIHLSSPLSWRHRGGDAVGAFCRIFAWYIRAELIQLSLEMALNASALLASLPTYDKSPSDTPPVS
jgi:hypothetical protein